MGCLKIWAQYYAPLMATRRPISKTDLPMKSKTEQTLWDIDVF